MKFIRPPTESQPRPRKAVDVLRATESEPESGLMFDPKIDISQENEKLMFSRLKKMRRYGEWEAYCELAMHLSFIYPERKAEIKLDETDFLRLKGELVLNRMRIKEDLSRGRVDNFIRYFLSLYPDHRHELGLDEGKFTNMKGLIDHYAEAPFIIAKNIDMLIFFPDRRTELRLGEKEFNIMRTLLDEFRRGKEWEHFCDFAAAIFILYPDRKCELKIGEAEFNGMKAAFTEYCRNKEVYEIAEMATDLSILAAERAEIDENGQIRLTYKKKDIAKKLRPLPIVSRV